MKHLIIFHYHFLPGGVTDVVVSAVQAYLRTSREIDTVTLVSGRSDNLDQVSGKISRSLTDQQQSRFDVIVEKEIDYKERLSAGISIASLKQKLTEKYLDDGTVWWIHNYHLGKNPYFTGALLEIAASTSQKMVFHIHDFPECSRYELFSDLRSIVEGDIYSLEENIRYAVINSRDYKYLLEAGIPESRLFLLENPVKTGKLESELKRDVGKSLSEAFSHRFPLWKCDEPYMLYPVRAIRRKNVAEAAFTALLTGKNIIVTLPGVSDREKKYSERVSRIFEKGLAPGLFGIGQELEKADISFADLIASSSLIYSSSIQEGFGYLFLNSMNWGKPLVARDLDVLENFKPAFSGYKASFYKEILVPASVIDKETLERLYRDKILKLNHYLQQSIVSAVNRQIDELLYHESIDFSFLTLDMQIDILEKLKNNTVFMNQCRNINKKVINDVNHFFLTDCSHRRDILESKWSYKIYSKETDAILHSFSSPEPREEQGNHRGFIYESTLKKFASLPYLRLLYDE